MLVNLGRGMSGIGNSIVANAARAIASNANAVPLSFFSASTSYVRNCRKRRVVPSNANYSQIKLTYVNWAAGMSSESQVGPTVVLSSAIEYNGVLYPVTFGGAATYTLTAGSTVESDAVAGLTLPAGAVFYERNRLVGPSSGSYAYPNTQVCSAIWGEFHYLGTDTAIDYTTGLLTTPATATAVVVGGNITATTLTGGGSGYTTNVSLYAYQVETDGQLTVKNIGSGIITGNTVTTTSITSGTPVAGRTWVNPVLVFAYGNPPATSSNAIAMYSAALVTGIPSVPVKSLITMGDSIIRGNGLAAPSDLKQNQGIYEIAVGNRCGIFNCAIGGTKLFNLQGLATYPKLYALIAAAGGTHALLVAGTNDSGDGRTKAQMEGYISTITGALRGYGLSTSVGTIIAATTGDGTTLNGQTPRNVGYNQGGVVDLVNADIVSGAVVSDWSYIDARPMLDATNTAGDKVWRVDLGVISSDLVHPSGVGLGIAQLDATFKGQFAALA